MASSRASSRGGSRGVRLAGLRGRAGAALAGRARGFTLVEVIVALVVLMIGIYGMLRIFPRGFSAIEVSRQRTTAAQLAEAELARWRLHPETLPDGIVATDYEGNLVEATLINSDETLQSLLVYGELAAQMPGSTNYETLQLPRGDVSVGNLDFYARPFIYNPLDVTPSQFDAALEAARPTPMGLEEKRPNRLHPNWQPNSLYLPRTVIGERIDIRRLGTGARGAYAQEESGPGVPFYLLSQAPLDVLRYEGTDDPATAADERRPVYVDIYDAELWEHVLGGDPTLLGEREFTYVASDGFLHFGPYSSPPAEGRRFKVDYTDPVTRQRVLGVTVIVPPGQRRSLPPLPPGLDARTVQVHERLRYESDRSRLRLEGPAAPRKIYYVDTESTISGKIEFPRVLQTDPRPDDITVVKVDYRVFDWQVLSFDVEVPEDGVVRLPVAHLKGPDHTNPPRQLRAQEVARGIKKHYDWGGQELPSTAGDPRTWAYVVAVDRQSGEILADHEGAEWPANPHERLHRFRVDYTNGLLYFNYGEWEVVNFDYGLEGNLKRGTQWLHSRGARTFRIFCRSESDWAVQLMVAARRYARSAERVPGRTPIGGERAVAGLTYAWSEEHPRQLYFPLSEAGQAVAIDYYTAREDAGDEDSLLLARDSTEDLVYVDGEVHTIGPPNVTGLGVWACPLAELLENRPNRWGPLAVRGIGVRARAAWVTPGQDYTLQELTRAMDEVDSQGRPGRPRPVLNETWRQMIVSTYLTRAPI